MAEVERRWWWSNEFIDLVLYVTKYLWHVKCAGWKITAENLQVWMRQSLNFTRKAFPVMSWVLSVKEVWFLLNRCEIHSGHLLKILEQTQVFKTPWFYPELLTYTHTAPPQFHHSLPSRRICEQPLFPAITSQANQRGQADSSGREVSIATASCKMVAGIAGTITCLSVLSKKQEDVEEGEQ